MSKVSFNNTQSPFFQSLKKRVDEYFESNKIHRAGNVRLYLKSIFQVTTAILLYIILVFFTPAPLLSIFLCALLGINFAIIGFNISHEGGHQTFSKYKWLNSLSSYFLNVLGANSFFWKIKHNINHHTYTNIEGLDSDIDIEPFMRINENQPRRWFHRFQFVYWIFLYGISYLAWIFYQDFEKYFSCKVAQGSQLKNLTFKEHFVFWLTKLSYLLVYMVIPIITVGFTSAVIGYLVISFVCGLFISIVFQLAHVVEGTSFPKPDEVSNKIENEWAIHQLNTTANFGTNSKIISWLLGGLNFQVEHHLFPKISHIHYPKINKIVKETCKEFDIVYIEYSSFISAFYSHLMHLKKLGRG